jgi:hypothetical protein
MKISDVLPSLFDIDQNNCIDKLIAPTVWCGKKIILLNQDLQSPAITDMTTTTLKVVKIFAFALLILLTTPLLLLGLPIKTVQLLLRPTLSTSDDFGIIKPEDAGRLYEMMDDINTLFKEHNIPYSLTSGSLLGQVRHNGIIPWDDDIDIMVLPKAELIMNQPDFRNKLSNLGYVIKDHWQGYKIYPKELPETLSSEWGETTVTYAYPFIDVFTTEDHGDRIRYQASMARQLWPNEYLLKEEITALESTPFGPLYVPAPSREKSIQAVQRFYSKDCMEKAIRIFDHKNNQRFQRGKVTITDFKPAAFTSDRWTQPLTV